MQTSGINSSQVPSGRQQAVTQQITLKEQSKPPWGCPPWATQSCSVKKRHPSSAKQQAWGTTGHGPTVAQVVPRPFGVPNCCEQSNGGMSVQVPFAKQQASSGQGVESQDVPVPRGTPPLAVQSLGVESLQKPPSKLKQQASVVCASAVEAARSNTKLDRKKRFIDIPGSFECVGKASRGIRQAIDRCQRSATNADGGETRPTEIMDDFDPCKIAGVGTLYAI